MATDRGRVCILFGSQTGCAEEVAHRIAAEACRRQYAPSCLSIEDFDVRQLPAEKLIIFVVSTTGEGEVPDAMRTFWQFLLRRDLPAQSLAALHHACFGLGDSTYPKFCYAAKRLHRRLAQLGSSPMLACGLGDDQDAHGIDHHLGPWLKQLWSHLDERMPLPDGLIIPDESDCPPPRYRVTIIDDSTSSTKDGASVVPSRPASDTDKLPTGRRQPHRARVLENRLLTREGCGREVRHIEFDVSGWGLSYAPGDALAVQPVNPERATAALLTSLGLPPRGSIRIEAALPHARPLHWAPPNKEVSVFELFSRRLDLFGVPRRSFFALLAHFATNPDQKERLQEFGSVEGADDLLEYATRPRRTYAEVLLDFTSARPPLSYYLDLLPPLRERYFSIASSPQLHPTAVHICVAIVRYQSQMQAPRFGVCSTYLAGLTPAAAETEGDLVEVWLRQGCLRLPDTPSAPIVMIGPGTGVAPFRSFVQTRQAQRTAPSEHVVGDACLFFGCRRAGDDYLYADEWQAHVERGELNQLHAAHSREPGQPKLYVQHRMLEPAISPRLWALLAQPNCHVYIAGSANQMPKAVRKALCGAAMAHGGQDEEAAREWLKKLEIDKRLQCETW